MYRIFFITFLLCLYEGIFARNSGLKTTVQETAINYMVAQYSPIIRDKVKHIDLPPYNYQSDVLKVSVSNIHLNQLNFNSIHVRLLADKALQVDVSGCFAILNADFNWDAIWIAKGGGTLDVNIVLSLFVRVQMSIQTGRPVATSSVDVQVSSIDVKVTTGSIIDQVLNWIVDQFKGPIKDSFQNILREKLKPTIDSELMKMLSGIDLRINMQELGWLDCSFMDMTFVSSNYLSVGLLGQVTTKSGLIVPGEPSFIPDKSVSHPDSMIQIAICEYIFNSLLFSFISTGKGSTIITDDIIPAKIGIRLSTTFFRDRVPILYQKFGAKNMTLIASFTNAPIVSIDEHSIKISSNSSLKFQVNVSNTTRVDVFELKVDFPIEGNITVKSNATATVLHGELGDLLTDDIKISLISSQIGVIDMGRVSPVIIVAVRTILLPLAKEGIMEIPLPSVRGLQLQNPFIEHSRGYMRIDSDFTYSPPQ